MNFDYIMALGSFLQYYYKDLNYILNFHKHKNGQLSTDEYLRKSDGTFKSFLDEFRVARNIKKTDTAELLRLTMTYISGNEIIKVDDFAELLNDFDITHGKIMTSLASKILFLNDPWHISPLDNLVKKAIGLKQNNYYLYQIKFIEYKLNHINELNDCVSSVLNYAEFIENQFRAEIPNIEIIRLNRFLDKVLWTIGKSK